MPSNEKTGRQLSGNGEALSRGRTSSDSPRSTTSISWVGVITIHRPLSNLTARIR